MQKHFFNVVGVAKTSLLIFTASAMAKVARPISECYQLVTNVRALVSVEQGLFDKC